MESIILITEDYYSIDDIESIPHFGYVKKSKVSDREIIYEFHKGFIRYEIIPSLIEEYDEEELKKIPYENPSFILVESSPLSLIRKVICRNYFSNNIYIDNDHDIIEPIRDYIDRIRNDQPDD